MADSPRLRQFAEIEALARNSPATQRVAAVQALVDQWGSRDRRGATPGGRETVQRVDMLPGRDDEDLVDGQDVADLTDELDALGFGDASEAPSGPGAEALSGFLPEPSQGGGGFGSSPGSTPNFGGLQHPGPFAGFGSIAPSSFGASSMQSPVFGSPTSIFGAQTPQGGGFGSIVPSSFGAPSMQSPVFGSPTSIFGVQTPQGGGFGSIAPSSFGAPSMQSPVFGSPTSIFGVQTPQGGGFGSIAPSSFGAPSTRSPVFGSPTSIFGAQTPQGGGFTSVAHPGTPCWGDPSSLQSGQTLWGQDDMDTREDGPASPLQRKAVASPWARRDNFPGSGTLPVTQRVATRNNGVQNVNYKPQLQNVGGGGHPPVPKNADQQRVVNGVAYKYRNDANGRLEFVNPPPGYGPALVAKHKVNIHAGAGKLIKTGRKLKNTRYQHFLVANMHYENKTKPANKGSSPPGLTWHHHPTLGYMELIDRDVHAAFGHHGGFSIWGS